MVRDRASGLVPVVGLWAACLWSCSGGVDSGATGKDPTGRTGSSGEAGQPGTNAGTAGSSGGSGVAGMAGTSTGTGGQPPAGFDEANLIPSRIRRLTNAEYDGTVKSLLGTSASPGESFAPDARQAGFTLNDAQRVDPVLAKQLSQAAESLAAEAVANKLDELAPCGNPTADAETCATEFIESFGAKVYRRPLSSEEALGLLEVYRTGAEGASYADGIELSIRALLQSPGFLYLTELGGGPPDATVALTPYELASELSYLLTGAPPDEALLEAALGGALGTPEGREAQARRLRQLGAISDERVVRILREWLGTDRLERTAKDTNVYPEFDRLKPSMVLESRDFISAVISANHTGSVSELLAADWTVAEQPLAAFYGTSGSGEVNLPTRRGILNQGAFLSVYAHANESAPVLRGVAIARRIACLNVPSPTELDINVVPPVPDPSKTTRERFTIHSTDPVCAGCHSMIDPFGFSFEQFDGMAAYRDTENGQPVDSSASISVSTDFDGDYADSNELAVALANSPSVKSCFARFMFRALAGRSDASVANSERAFLESWGAMSESERDNIVEALITFIKSPLFTHRRAQ